MSEKYIIPIFVPHLGCPNNCTFCNQKSISGQMKNVTKEEGPDHSKVFTAEVKCNGKSLATGTGSTKKQAEMEAARRVLTDFDVKK